MTSRRWGPLAGVLALALALPAAGCGGCGAPRETTYSCKPAPPGSTGCVGRPSGGGGIEVFPPDCRVEFPECLQAFPNEIKRCICNDSGHPGVFEWFCPD